MAGLHRRKFINIISDKFTEHYQGKVAEQDLDEALQKIAALIARLDNSKQDGRKLRAETLQRLKRVPLEKLQEMLSVTPQGTQDTL